MALGNFKQRASLMLVVSLWFALFYQDFLRTTQYLITTTNYHFAGSSIAVSPTTGAAGSASLRESIQRHVLNVNDQSIRKWGCNITATPFVFVHIGKAGGGNIRRRIARAALNVTRGAEHWSSPLVDEHYYPIVTQDGSVHRAKFCSSRRHRHQPAVVKSFEGYSQRCTAETVLGHILACPEFFNMDCGELYHPLDPNAAHLVYVGHNFFGSEVHWLPIPYLKAWWSTYWSRDLFGADDPVLKKMDSLDGDQPWCELLPRPLFIEDLYEEDRDQHWDCAQTHIQPQADAWARETVMERFSKTFLTPQQQGRAWGEMYASLPVTRVTVLREPISWLRSKYDWHQLKRNHNLTCDDIATATALETYTDLHDTIRPGWVRRMALEYILQLCGEDCHTRMQLGKATLQEIESQAAYNLRHSFAVVGVLEDQDTFFEMIHARVDYMDMHLNTNIFGGGRHGTHPDIYCAARFNDTQFQRDLIAAAPELASLLRLYEIGVEVNRFQRQELQQCSGMPLVAPKRR